MHPHKLDFDFWNTLNNQFWKFFEFDGVGRNTVGIKCSIISLHMQGTYMLIKKEKKKETHVSYNNNILTIFFTSLVLLFIKKNKLVHRK